MLIRDYVILIYFVVFFKYVVSFFGFFLLFFIFLLKRLAQMIFQPPSAKHHPVFLVFQQKDGLGFAKHFVIALLKSPFFFKHFFIVHQIIKK